MLLSGLTGASDSPSPVLLAFDPRISPSAYNLHFGSFPQPCPLQHLLGLSAIPYCTKAIALCSSFTPQKDIFFPWIRAAEHGPLNGKAAPMFGTSHHGWWP